MTEQQLIDDYTAALRAEDAHAIITTGQALDAYDKAERDRWNEPGALGRFAAWYARHGIPVFPLRPGQKIPLPGSRGFKDATTDEAVIAAWWANTPEANIGMPTGRIWDVVDVDAPKGPWSLARNPVRGDALRGQSIGEVLTPGGGWHWYMPLIGARNGAGIAEGVDLRGDGGYVVIPPSRVDGRHYRWTRVPTELAAGTK